MTYYYSSHLAAYQAACQRVESLESSLRIYRSAVDNGHSSCGAAFNRIAAQLDDAILAQVHLAAELKAMGVPGFEGG